jgi:hypothetical protein
VTDRKSPVDQALDLLIYAPLGFLFNATEVVPQLAEQGKRQVQLARVFGHYAVDRQAPKLIARLQVQTAALLTERLEQARRVGRPAPSRNGTAAPTARRDPGTGAGPSTPASPAGAADPPPGPRRASSDGAAHLAIPDYDSLSASQVVPRLEGLSMAELGAVADYETDHRGRRTILNKVAQLRAG